MNKISDLNIGAIKEIYSLYHSVLCFFAYKYTKSYDEAEDIVHSVFAKIIEKGVTLENDFTIKSYLFSSVRNASLNYIKKDNVRKRYSEYSSSNETGTDNSSYLLDRIETEILFEIFSKIDALPSGCNKVFRLSYIEGLSNQEIADKLGISLNTVKSQKARAKQLLKESLKDLFIIALYILKNYF